MMQEKANSPKIREGTMCKTKICEKEQEKEYETRRGEREREKEGESHGKRTSIESFRQRRGWTDKLETKSFHCLLVKHCWVVGQRLALWPSTADFAGSNPGGAAQARGGGQLPEKTAEKATADAPARVTHKTDAECQELARRESQPDTIDEDIPTRPPTVPEACLSPSILLLRESKACHAGIAAPRLTAVGRVGNLRDSKEFARPPKRIRASDFAHAARSGRDLA